MYVDANGRQDEKMREMMSVYASWNVKKIIGGMPVR